MKIYTDENCDDLVAMRLKYPAYIQIYLNIDKKAGITKLHFTKHSGQILYALSEKDHDNIYKMLECTQDIIDKEVKEDLSIKKVVKNTRQNNLAGFLNKKD